MKINEALDFLVYELQIDPNQSHNDYCKQIDKIKEVVELLNTYEHIIQLIKKTEWGKF